MAKKPKPLTAAERRVVEAAMAMHELRKKHKVLPWKTAIRLHLAEERACAALAKRRKDAK